MFGSVNQNSFFACKREFEVGVGRRNFFGTLTQFFRRVPEAVACGGNEYAYHAFFNVQLFRLFDARNVAYVSLFAVGDGNFQNRLRLAFALGALTDIDSAYGHAYIFGRAVQTV